MDFAALFKAERAKARAAAGAKQSAAEAPLSPPVQQSSAAAPLHHYLLPARFDRQRFDPRAHTVRCGIGGVAHVREWVSSEEEAELLRCADSAPPDGWTTLRGRRLQMFGGQPAMPMVHEPLPAWVQSVCEQLVRAGVFPEDSPPNHVLLNEYQPGQGIDAHKDGPLYAARVAILSLGSHTAFEFLEEDTSSDVIVRRPLASLLLPRRGLLVFEGDAYAHALHTVSRATEDDMSALLWLGGRGADGALAEATDEVAPEAVAEMAPETALPEQVAPETARRRLGRGRRVSLTIRRVLCPGDPWEVGSDVVTSPTTAAALQSGVLPPPLPSPPPPPAPLSAAAATAPTAAPTTAPTTAPTPAPLSAAAAAEKFAFSRLLDLMPSDEGSALSPAWACGDARAPLSFRALRDLSRRLGEQLLGGGEWVRGGDGEAPCRAGEEGDDDDDDIASSRARHSAYLLPHERVATSLPSSPELAACFLALSSLLPLAPLNPDLSDAETLFELEVGD